MKQNIAREMREELKTKIGASVVIEGFDYVGNSSEGACYTDGNECIVIRPIIKAEGTDIMAQVEEFEEKQKKAEEKAKNKVKKKEKDQKKREKATK